MDRTEKSDVIENLRDRFAKAPFVILADFQGSNPLQMDAIRRRYEPLGVQFKVVKNTLARRAVAGTELEVLTPHLKGNIGVIFSGDDAQSAAKLFRDLVKENEKLIAKAGYFDGTLLDGKGVATVADLPSKAELLGKMLATLQETPRRMLGVLQGPGRDLMYVLGNYARKLEEQG
jgi:large subunit ribosomal protein L10